MKCELCGGKGWLRGHPLGIQIVCPVCDGKGYVELTNEEWFCSLSTEDKARVLRRKTYGNSEENESVEQAWMHWLKAKHEDNPPDIPSVPSWDNWLKGEKTKCEYCDGNTDECELAGRFECPRTPKNNEEYIRSCSAEELPKALKEMFFYIKSRVRSELGGYNELMKSERYFDEWLKEKHE